MNKLQIKHRRKLVEICFKRKIGHIASALSFIDCWYKFSKLVKDDSALVIGNANIPVLFNNFYNKPINQLLKYNNLYPDVDIIKCNYASISLGNSIGIAAGIALSKKYNTTYITIGDSILHAGTELEAAMYIGNNFSKMSNIVLIVNANNFGCISEFQNFNIDICNIFNAFKWNVICANGHDYTSIDNALLKIKNTMPNCIVCNTIKGYGVSFIQNNANLWHYKTLDNITYKDAMLELT